MDLLQGSVVRSLAGHDKGMLLVVTSYDDKYVYIADGKQRKLSDPKRKNRKHIECTGKVIVITEITDKTVRKLLREMDSLYE